MGRSPSTPWAYLDHPGPIPFAHRGGALEAPENSWAAFERARRLGFRYLETDARATADGVAVALHDPILDRVSDRSGRVRDLPWPAVAAARLAGGGAVPRLEDLLGSWPDARWNIDAKDDAVVEPLVEAIRRTGSLERVCVTSFADRRVRQARRALGPGLCTAPGRAGVARLRAASLFPGAGTRVPGAAILAEGRRHGAAQVPRHHGRVRVVDHRLVAAAHRVGLQVHVWTVDDAAAMEDLLDLGVDGIMTDRPEVLRAVLERRGQWA